MPTLPKLTRVAIKCAYQRAEALEYEACLEKYYSERVARDGDAEAKKWLRTETLFLLGPGVYRMAKRAIAAWLFT